MSNTGNVGSSVVHFIETGLRTVCGRAWVTRYATTWRAVTCRGCLAVREAELKRRTEQRRATA